MFDKYPRQSSRPQSERWSGRLVKLPGEVENDLTSDLEWMANSRQVSDEVVVEAVLGEYSQWLYWLSSTLLEDTAQVKKVFINVIEDLLLKRERLWDDVNVQLWLFRHTIQVSQRMKAHRLESPKKRRKDPFHQKNALDNLDEKYRVPLILHFLVGFSEEQTAEILRTDVQQVHKRIGAVVDYLSEYRTNPPGDNRPLMDRWVKKALLERWQLTELSNEDTETIKNEILSRVGKNARFRGLIGRGLKVGFGVVAIAMALIIVWLTNAMTPPPETRSPLVSTVLVTRLVEKSIRVTATPSPTAVVNQDGRESLSEKPSIEEVRQHILASRSRWDTLWMDGRIIDYGPVGYIGRPKVRREQVWIGQPYNSLVLSGWAGGHVDQIWFSLNGKVYDINPDSGEPVLYDFHTDQLPVYSSFTDYLLPKSIVEDWSEFGFNVVGSGQAAGRRTLILEGRNPDSDTIVRYWVDNYTGIILRMMRFGADGASVLFEIVVREISLDVEFPSRIFDRNNLPLHFGSSYYGEPFPIKETLPGNTLTQYPGHIPKLRITPPPGFDPSESRVSFQWDQQPPVEAWQNFTRWSRYPENFGGEIPVDLFADPYHVGKLAFNPWYAVCSRSADGSTIALHSVTGPYESAATTLSWFDLQNSFDVNVLDTGEKPFSLAVALSPNGRKLAFHGCLDSDQKFDCGVFVLDTKTGSYTPLVALQWVDQFLWGPEGESLAVIAPSIVQVFNTVSGRITYSRAYSPQDKPALEDTPIRDWGIDFASQSQGLEACLKSPAVSN